MSLTQVVPQLRRRGLKIDTCSWYPWLHMEQECGGSCLGMDSCAMFYIGGDVECEMPWNLNRIGDIFKAAVHPCRGPQSRPIRLDAYSGDNKPGMLWNRYKSMKNEKPNDRTLEDKLKDLLEPSTNQYTLDSLRAANMSVLSPHLRLRQKELDKKEWLVDAATGVVHNGAHFPLFMVTRNSGHRSEEAHAERQNKWPYWNQQWVWRHEAKANAHKDKTAVAAHESWTAVAASSSSPAWIERRTAASSGTPAGESMVEWTGETAVAANESRWMTAASSGRPTRDAPNCDGEHWEYDQSMSDWWTYDQSWSDWDWSGSHWDGKCSKKWK